MSEKSTDVVHIGFDVYREQLERMEEMATEAGLPTTKALILQAISVYDMILKAYQDNLLVGFTDKLENLQTVIRPYNIP